MIVDGREVPPGHCPNCREPLPDHEGGFPNAGGVFTPDGVLVHADCVKGWKNGEEMKELLELVGRAKLACGR